jgi:hypothetical protein
VPNPVRKLLDRIILVMKHRIGMWAGVGLVVMSFWGVYFLLTTRIPRTPTEPIAWTLARLTCPIMFASYYFHFPVGIFWAFLANATTYALVGLTVETLRQKRRQKCS